ncbi:sensor histidine kinase [Glaciihabitans sp. INWT7]|uniref:sensor histidine kinase n=1 Tax=Glaciihabitans sp. INWT7 TaxID=2596912 RepID=UPI002106E22B|nr:sensor histidine kinase [Glaciihabitans sp. INWT7]
MTEPSSARRWSEPRGDVDREWVRPGPERQEYVRDAALAAVLLGATALSTLLSQSAGFSEHPSAIWISALYVVMCTAPLALRRRWPEAVAVVVGLVFALSQILSVPEMLFANISLFIALYSVGAWGRHRLRATIVRVVIVIGMFVWLFTALVAHASDPGSFANIPRNGAISPIVALGLLQIVTNLLYFGGAFYFGDRAWAAARERSALVARTAELAAERELNAERAVSLERVRIARDLHDIVAHHVSVMGVQAGAARRVVGSDPEGAAASLRSIESSARTAVAELHRMLTTLRDDEQPPGDAPSTRGLDQLSTLVADTRGAGVTILSRTVGTERPVPPTIGATLYRVAQEAITNTLKHAGPGAEIDLRLRYLDDAVELELGDSGSGSAVAAPGTGHGQLGMRERVDAVGGTIQIGPRARGGYLVRARIPTGEAG